MKKILTNVLNWKIHVSKVHKTFKEVIDDFEFLTQKMMIC